MFYWTGMIIFTIYAYYTMIKNDKEEKEKRKDFEIEFQKTLNEQDNYIENLFLNITASILIGIIWVIFIPFILIYIYREIKHLFSRI